ncbi:hypothetical protein CMO92_04635 [Candidatus Woesearchaeota archaeon]|nr:hypothetical protein [Candidatus Woesearchaeota archaeon]
MQKISIIVPGALNTDLVASGIKEFVQPGQQQYGTAFSIYPGGKSRNIAQMIASLVGPNKVAMIGKTCKDPNNLWKPPIDGLLDAGVNTSHIKLLSAEEAQTHPGIAFIHVNTEGTNSIYVLPGINATFSPQDIDDAQSLFTNAQHTGILVLSLEMPKQTAYHAIQKAHQHNIKVFLDPGAYKKEESYDDIYNNLYLIKPNEHEAEHLTGIKVTDKETAKQAAAYFLQRNVQNVLITLGEQGAYLFTKETEQHIPTPKLSIQGEKNATGCGDQTIAALAAAISQGKPLEQAAKQAILAGTLQFYKAGIVPVTNKEIEEYTQHID